MSNESCPNGYEFCVNEGERCDFSGTADIAYGANGSFYYKYGVTNGIDCNNSVFGDPIWGTPKACYIKGGGPPSYTFCANENERCNFSGTANVAYGASLKYIYKYGITGGIDCNNSIFGGDPIYGTIKACYYKSTGPPLLNKIYIPLVRKPVCATSNNPNWKILVLAYESTDFIYTDGAGQQRHFIANMTQAEKDRVTYAVNRFVYTDIPELNSCNMQPIVTIRYPAHTLTNLTPAGCGGYAPSPNDAANDRDSAFDSIISVWDGSGTDINTGQTLTIHGWCAYAWPMGTGQTYDALYLESVQYNNRNVFKHEWGHSILFYFDAAGTAPKPAVNNHINNTTDQYVNCISGQPYILQDETDDNLIPNSIYHNVSGFTHDYYSGFTATADQPSRCLGIPSYAWASGGPVTKSPSTLYNQENLWDSPSDDIIGTPVPYQLEK